MQEALEAVKDGFEVDVEGFYVGLLWTPFFSFIIDVDALAVVDPSVRREEVNPPARDGVGEAEERSVILPGRDVRGVIIRSFMITLEEGGRWGVDVREDDTPKGLRREGSG